MGECCDHDAAEEILAKAEGLGIGHGDHLFFSHPERGVMSGKVLAIGKDGCTLESGEDDKAERHPVLWEHVLGHKQRAERKYIPVEQGDDGMIAEDAATGRRVFLQGEIPEDDEQDGEIVAKAFMPPVDHIAESLQKAMIQIADSQFGKIEAVTALVEKMAAQAPDIQGLVAAFGEIMQKAMAESAEQNAGQLSALAVAVEKLAQQEKPTEQMVKAFAAVMENAQKPIGLNLKLDMQAPERKPVHVVARRNEAGEMVAEVRDAG